MIPAATPYTSPRRVGRSGRDRARAFSPAMRARSDAPGPGGAVLVRVPVVSHSRFACDIRGARLCWVDPHRGVPRLVGCWLGRGSV